MQKLANQQTDGRRDVLDTMLRQQAPTASAFLADLERGCDGFLLATGPVRRQHRPQRIHAYIYTVIHPSSGTH